MATCEITGEQIMTLYYVRVSKIRPRSEETIGFISLSADPEAVEKWADTIADPETEYLLRWKPANADIRRVKCRGDQLAKALTTHYTFGGVVPRPYFLDDEWAELVEKEGATVASLQGQILMQKHKEFLGEPADQRALTLMGEQGNIVRRVTDLTGRR